MQECPDRISTSKKKTVKKAVPVEEPSSDHDIADRISPSAMPLKKRPVKKVYGQLVLLQTRTESTRTFSLVNSYFFATRTLVNSYFFFGQLVLFFGQLVLFLWSTRTF